MTTCCRDLTVLGIADAHKVHVICKIEFGTMKLRRIFRVAMKPRSQSHPYVSLVAAA